jgi:hypothetical protein
VPDVLETAMTTATKSPGRVRAWTPIRVPGYHADRFEFTLDHGEHQRRQAVGLGGVTYMGILEVLMNLPPGHPVPWPSLSDYAKRTIPKWPEGILAAERSGRCYASVTSLLTRPAMDGLALVYGKRFALGHLNRAARFAPMGRRAVIYPPGVVEKSDPFDVAQYQFYGVGVGEHDGDGVRWLLEPAPYRPMRFTAAAWSFSEMVYGEWLRHATDSQWLSESGVR